MSANRPYTALMHYSDFRSRFRKTLALSLPVATATLGTNVLGLIDTAMIGRLGDLPLAAAGLGNFLFLLFLALPFGVATASQTLVARRLGENSAESAGYDLNAALLISAAFALLLSALMLWLVPDVLRVLKNDPELIRLCSDYLLARGPSLFLMAWIGCFRAFWNGLHIGRCPIYALLVMLLVNTLGNYVLIFGHWGVPALGVLGAGLASSLAALAGVFTYLLLGLHSARRYGFLRSLPSAPRVVLLLRLAVPQGFNLLFISLGLLLLMSIVAALGVAELAIVNVLINFIFIAYLFVEGFGIASMSLVSEALGGQRVHEARRYGWENASLGAACVFFLGLFLALAPEAVLALFIVDVDTREAAVLPARFLGLWLWLDAFGKILSFSLIGAGATRAVLLITLISWWGIGLPTQWWFGVKLGYGINGIFLVPLPLMLGVAILLALLWYRGQWQHALARLGRNGATAP